jgi:hypothetical protein
MSDPETPSSRPSQIPSWMMLGFILGALFVLALPSRTPPPPPAPAPVPVIEPAPPPTPQRLTTIEAVFAQWGRHAVWENDMTEVGLWDTATKEFSDCYEVIRSGDEYYFRSIPHLTRPVIAPVVSSDCPLQFTESEDHRLARVKGEEEEVFKDLGGGK